MLWTFVGALGMWNSNWWGHKKTQRNFPKFVCLVNTRHYFLSVYISTQVPYRLPLHSWTSDSLPMLQWSTTWNRTFNKIKKHKCLKTWHWWDWETLKPEHWKGNRLCHLDPYMPAGYGYTKVTTKVSQKIIWV